MWGLCSQVPVTFGEFNISDVRPAQLFDVLADLDGQLKWDNSISEAGDTFQKSQTFYLCFLCFESCLLLCPCRLWTEDL